MGDKIAPQKFVPVFNKYDSIFIDGWLKMDIKIREADLRDFNQIDSLCEELLGSSVGDREEMFRKALENRDYLCLVAEIKEEVVGFTDMWAFPDVSHGAYLAQIQNLVVTEKIRGKGIGTKLVEEMIGFFRKREYHELHVWTEKKNRVAIQLYKRLGFIKEQLLLEMES
jgi:ribosomal protein S18 acetylase RimI-like enzyme